MKRYLISGLNCLTRLNSSIWLNNFFVGIILFSLFLLPVSGFAIDIPQLKGYVNDYADIISPSAEQRLEEELRSFEQTDSTQLVILTIPSLEGEVIEDFSIRVADAWKIGQAVKDNGIILLVAKEDKKMRIEVGRGLEGRLTDLVSGRIIDLAIKPGFKRGDYDQGFLMGVSALIDAARGEFKAEDEQIPDRGKGHAPIFTFLIFIIVFLVVLGAISKILSAIGGAIGLPLLIHLLVFPLGLISLIILAGIGLFAGFLLPIITPFGGHHRRGGIYPGGGFYGSGGSGFGGSGFSGGGFSGGGGGFGGGGASGNW